MEWIAHRGMNHIHTENTKPAFDHAVRAGCSTLETDLRMCASGDIVLCHDTTMERLGGPSAKVSSQTRTELAKLSLGKTNCQPLFLDEFLALYPGHDWVLDIKQETSEAVVDELVKLYGDGPKQHWFASHASFVLWDPGAYSRIQKHFPGCRIFRGSFDCYKAAIANRVGLPILSGVKAGEWYSLTPELAGIKLFKKSLVAKYQRRGGKVLAFLPKDEDQLQQALGAGFDAILCDWAGPKQPGNEG